jgi:hypothetical protein
MTETRQIDRPTAPRLSEILPALPESLREPYTLAQMLASSGYFPDVKSVSQAFTRLVFGKALGLSPLEAMTGIYFVKGRLALSASLMASLVRRSSRYDYRIVELTEERCVIRFFAVRDGEREALGESVFTIEDARRAGLAEGENWRRYPRNMLFARALSNGVRWFCPDVLGGPVMEATEAAEAMEADVVELPPEIPEEREEETP